MYSGKVVDVNELLHKIHLSPWCALFLLWVSDETNSLFKPIASMCEACLGAFEPISQFLVSHLSGVGMVHSSFSFGQPRGREVYVLCLCCCVCFSVRAVFRPGFWIN